MPKFTLTKPKTTSIVGLDIEAGSIAATEVSLVRGASVTGFAIRPLDPGAFADGEVADADALSRSLKELFAENKLSKRVRIGLANQRVIVRTLRLPVIEDPKEMDAAVRFQAQEQMPMPLDEAVLEHQLVGGVPGEEDAAPQVDVIVVAARRDTIASFLEPVRRAGLQPVGVDLSAFAMIRALAGRGDGGSDAGGPANGNGNGNGEATPDGPPETGQAADGAVLYCNIGDVTNLAIARGRSCLFTRVSYAGLESIATRLRATRGLTPEHAAQWLTHVGLDAPLETIPGDPETVAETRRALLDGTTAVLDELRLSLDYYGAQEAVLPIKRVVICGPGSSIPGLAERMESGFDLPISVARPAALEGMDPPVAARLTLPFGLALED